MFLSSYSLETMFVHWVKRATITKNTNLYIALEFSTQ